jgi:hypothetical protein
MSRPQKIHPPIKGAFNNILASVATGSGAGKRTSERLVQKPMPRPAPLKKP